MELEGQRPAKWLQTLTCGFSQSSCMLFQWRKGQRKKKLSWNRSTWQTYLVSTARDLSQKIWLSESRGGSKNPPRFSLKSPRGSADVPFGLGTTTLESLQFQTQTSPTMCSGWQTRGGIGNWGREEQRNYNSFPIERQEKVSCSYATSLSFCCIWVTLQFTFF